jgi:hypothetical protein
LHKEVAISLLVESLERKEENSGRAIEIFLDEGDSLVKGERTISRPNSHFIKAGAQTIKPNK